MVALRAAEIDGFVARPDPSRAIVLVFGPDSGLVRERAEAILRASVDSPDDPFALVRLDGDDLAGDPARLVDEALTVPLFGGRRAVSVRAGGRNIVPAVEALLAAPIRDCRIVIEAGDLKRGAPLRNVCEKAAKIVALPCYADGERDLARLVDDEMRAAGLTITAEARATLVPLLGGDRRASRNEIRKLALYAHGQGRVELEDVLAVVADASALALDTVVDAAFAGRPGEVETQLAKALGGGVSPAAIVSAALRQASQLHLMRLTVEAGTPAGTVVEGAQPAIHFRRKPLVEMALKTWTSGRLERVLQQLGEASLEARRQAILGDIVAGRVLLSIAVAARRKD